MDIKGITIKINGDTSGLRKAIQSSTGESQELNKELKKVNRSLKFNPNNVDILKQKQMLLKQQIQETTDKLQSNKRELEKIKAKGVTNTDAHFRELQRDVLKGENQVKRLKGQLASVRAPQLKAIGNQMKSLGGKMAGAGAAASAAGAGLVLVTKKLVDAAEKQKSVEDKLEEIYRKRMGVSGKAAKSTEAYASKLQKVGVVGDEVTLSGAQQLATFAKTPSTVNKLLPAMDNLLVQQKGLNGTQQDATQIANLMGKVMMGQTGALKRVGVSFTAGQEKVLKYGNEQQKAAMLSKVITQNVGEMNKKFAKTDSGKIQQAKNTLGDMQEEIGAQLLPVLADLAGWFSKNIMPKLEALINFMESHPIIAKIIVAVTGLLAVGGPLLIFTGSMVSAVGALTGAMGALNISMLPIIAIIAAIIVVAILLIKNWDKVKAAAKKVAKIVIGVWNKVKGVTSKVWGAIAGTVSVAWRKISGTVKKVGGTVKKAVSTVWGGIKGVTGKVWGGIKGSVGSAMKAIGKNTKKSLGEIKSAYKKNGGGIKGVAAATMAGASRVFRTYYNVINRLTGGRLGDALKTASKKFRGIKDSAKTHIGNAARVIWDGLSRIKDKFRGLKLRFPNIKLPHFRLKTGSKKLLGKKFTYPTGFDVSWYKKGGIFNSPQIIGVGEAGPEAVVPIKKLREYLGDADGGNTVNISVTVNGAESPEEWGLRMAKTVRRQLETSRG